MHRKVIESWDALWAACAKAGGTHWNYSRGMVRFRPMQKKPAALGTEEYIDSEAPVRVRFYLEEGHGFVERFRSEVLFQPPPVEEMALPPDFERWNPKRKRLHLDTLIQKLSSRRYPAEMAATIRSLIRALEIVRAQPAERATPQSATRAMPPQPTVTRQTPQPAASRPEKSAQPTEAQQKHPLATETQRKSPPPPAGTAPEQPAQIKDFWAFMEHPVAEQRLTALASLLTRDEDVAQNITQAVKKLPLLRALGLLPVK